MDPFVTVVVVVIVGVVAIAVLAGRADQRAASRIARQRERRDPIAAGVIRRADIDKTLERENERREARGVGPLRRSEFDSMVVADARTRRKVWLWRGHR